MLFIPITIGAAGLQVARNAMQRTLLAGGGPWGATLVRFLFGLPFSLVFVAIAFALWPDASAHFSGRFWTMAAIGAAAQIGATAALLVSIHRAGFGLAAIFQQSSLPFAALLGWLALGEGLSATGWIGVAMASMGLFILAWPKSGAAALGSASGVWLGLVSGAFYAVALNTFRVANLTVEPDHPMVAAVLTTSTTQAIQTCALVLWLLARDRAALVAVLRAWRQSLSAGFFGAAASALWLMALGLAPAGQVRAVGVVEMPIAAAAGRKLFAERLSWRQGLLGAVVAVGVICAALG
jgi:drug/metabolite transporter (DMT)-like permease